MTLRVGVLALQGDYREHAAVVDAIGGRAVLVRRAAHLEDLDALILPGGESTTIAKLAVCYEMMEPMRKLIGEGLPTLGTCAGLILLASSLSGNDQPLLGTLDVVVQRNAYGRQVDSFEADVDVREMGTLRGVFIRAPRIEKVGEGVEVLGLLGGDPVVVRQGATVATSFHPELTGDDRLHTLVLDLVEER